jgi:hypothetical protein
VEGLNCTPRYFWNRQKANISNVAIIMAVFPPNNKNVRKIIESEKFKINFERGSVKLMRGAIKTAKRKSSRNCQESTFAFKLNKAKVKQQLPNIAMIIL